MIVAYKTIHLTISFNFKVNKEQSFKNENTYDISMYEVKMEDEPLQEPEENASVQTKESKNPKNNEEKVNFFLKKLHA